MRYSPDAYHESPALEALGEQTQPVTVPPQDLDPISVATAEDKQVPGERVLGELRLHESGQAVEPLALMRRTA